MTFIFKTIAGLAGLILASPVFTLAAEKSIGQREYEVKCVMCHGFAGKGDGWLSDYLKTRPSSLTQLKKNNGGVFPFEHAYQVIDGRKEVLAHGPRNMPVWGAAYRVESEKGYDFFLGEYYVDEGVVRARILALIEHLSRLQE
jgi:mono/diheme cytochrome c family protein